MTGDPDEGEAYRLYNAAFHRTPDAGGLNYWTTALQTGTSPQQAAQDFLSSPEYTGQYSNLSNADYVTMLYQNVLGRAPDAGGDQYWQAQLNAGTSRAGVLLGFSDSLESRLNTGAATHDGWVFAPKSS